VPRIAAQFEIRKVRDMDVLFVILWAHNLVDKAVAPIEEPYSDRVNRRLAAIAEGILDEGITYDCLWDDFAAQGIKVEFD
jgi:hypothetical protein